MTHPLYIHFRILDKRKGVSSMDGIVLSLTGVILQVLGLVAAFGSLAVGAASLALQAWSKDEPRSPEDEAGRHNNIRTAVASSRAVGS